MYRVLTIEELKGSLISLAPEVEKSENPPLGLVLAGDFYETLLSVHNEDTYKRHVLGILFCNPQTPFFQSEISHSLETFHHQTSKNMDIFCAGFSAYVPESEEKFLKDKQKIIELNGAEWEFSAEALEAFKSQIRGLSKWQGSGETDLLLLEASISQKSVELDFENTLDLNLEALKRDGAITSVRSFIDGLTKGLAENKSIYQASDNKGISILKSFGKEIILNLLPKSLREAYLKAEHFAVKDLR